MNYYTKREQKKADKATHDLVEAVVLDSFGIKKLSKKRKRNYAIKQLSQQSHQS